MRGCPTPFWAGRRRALGEEGTRGAAGIVLDLRPLCRDYEPRLDERPRERGRRSSRCRPGRARAHDRGARQMLSLVPIPAGTNAEHVVVSAIRSPSGRARSPRPRRGIGARCDDASSPEPVYRTQIGRNPVSSPRRSPTHWTTSPWMMRDLLGSYGSRPSFSEEHPRGEGHGDASHCQIEIDARVERNRAHLVGDERADAGEACLERLASERGCNERLGSLAQSLSVCVNRLSPTPIRMGGIGGPAVASTRRRRSRATSGPASASVTTHNSDRTHEQCDERTG